MPDIYICQVQVFRADGYQRRNMQHRKAGLKTGDVIIQLGDLQVTDMQNYMKALGTFKKGDKTKVKIKRGNETLEVPVEF
jgi:S1-C subfamily serine protease